ncbi:MAG: hypothetical protein FWG15_03440 [Propionibacteriaceae bacterium]|nr:hypothetical protein [Propionibacteriaceae bacterium]
MMEKTGYLSSIAVLTLTVEKVEELLVLGGEPQVMEDFDPPMTIQVLHAQRKPGGVLGTKPGEVPDAVQGTALPVVECTALPEDPGSRGAGAVPGMSVPGHGASGVVVADRGPCRVPGRAGEV